MTIIAVWFYGSASVLASARKKKSSSEHTSQMDFIPRERRCDRKDSGEHGPGKKDGDGDSERDGELHLGWVGDARIGEGG